ncbi:MFS transporter [Rhodococcus opacus]|uniref:MFS transporter n=1 Tax=Rhodococcus opacus TaxID=37919 RepID=UPI00223651AA|nr:MFS transporter [Rhodococcus opacus]UZG60224.1 MHS family MFS transporter [Rhodococcus opacus]
MTSPTSEDKAPSTRKIALASLVGTTIEWYDLFIYTTAAAVVFNLLFFPEFDPLMGTLIAFSTYATAYIARPVGAVVFGHIGDRAGRKKTLTLTLMIMGIATFAVGLLPTYGSIGVVAPILLIILRFLQGLGLGGEWGGAVLMAVEHAPLSKRGFFGSWVQMGVPAGVILANLVWLAVATLSEDDLLAWGWRIPFLLSVSLIIVGMWVRARVLETPTFEKEHEAAEDTKMPIVEVLRDYWGQVLLTAGAYFATGVVYTVLLAFGLTYGTVELGLSRSTMLLVIVITAAVNFLLLPFFGIISDRFNRKHVYLAGIAGMGVLSFPLFWLMNIGNFWSVLLGYILIVVPFSAAYGPQSTLFAEIFRGRVRYSGLSIGYQLGAILGSALTPIATTALLAATGSVTSVAWYMVGACIISLLCAMGIQARPWNDESDDGRVELVTATESGSTR